MYQTRFTVSVDNNWTKVAKGLRFGKRIVAEESLSAMDDSATYLQRQVQLNIVEVDAIDTRKFFNSVEKKVQPFEAQIFSNEKYAVPIEYGRKPGSMPPKGVLVEWMIRHDIPLEKEYAIRYKIYKEGTVARPVFKPAFERGSRVVIRRFEVAGQRMVLRMFGMNRSLPRVAST